MDYFYKKSEGYSQDSVKFAFHKHVCLKNNFSEFIKPILMKATTNIQKLIEIVEARKKEASVIIQDSVVIESVSHTQD